MKKLSLIAWLLVILLAIPSWALAISVYYMPADNSAQDAAITAALNSHYTVTTGVKYTAFNGTQATLNNYNVVLFSGSSDHDMPVAGQTALKDFVLAGGGLITGEWVLWGASPVWPSGAYFTTLNDVLPGVSNTDYNSNSPITYTQLTANPVLNYHVTSPLTFSVTSIGGGTGSNIVAKSGATTYYTSNAFAGGAGLVGGSYGSGLGRVLDFSTCIGPDELSNAAYQQLLVNSVYWVAGNDSPVPIPASVLLLGSGLVGLVGMRKFWKKG